MKLLANIISVVGGPLIVSVPAAFLLVYRASNDVTYSLVWTIVSMSFVGIVGLFVLYGVMKGFFSNFDISKREERKPIFIFTAILTVIYFFLIIFLNGPVILLATLAILLLGVVIDSFINRKIKASIHLAVFSAFVFSLGLLYDGWFWLLILLIPVVAWSRIKLKRHTLRETIVGMLLGLFLVTVLYPIVKYILLIR